MSNTDRVWLHMYADKFAVVGDEVSFRSYGGPTLMGVVVEVDTSTSYGENSPLPKYRVYSIQTDDGEIHRFVNMTQLFPHS